MEDGRKAYEAMIDRAKECAVNGGAAIYPLIQDWYRAGAWIPTEQHETVTAMLVDSDNRFSENDLAPSALFSAWLDAGKPGLPKPVDPYGPAITVDTGGRCPVLGGEVIKWRENRSDGQWFEDRARDVPWNGAPRTFRRILADHPGDSYWHGKLETIPESGRVDLNIRDWVVNYSRNAGRCMAYSMTNELEPGDQFRRWLKGDA